MILFRILRSTQTNKPAAESASSSSTSLHYLAVAKKEKNGRGGPNCFYSTVFQEEKGIRKKRENEQGSEREEEKFSREETDKTKKKYA